MKEDDIENRMMGKGIISEFEFNDLIYQFFINKDESVSFSIRSKTMDNINGGFRMDIATFKNKQEVGDFLKKLFYCLKFL